MAEHDNLLIDATRRPPPTLWVWLRRLLYTLLSSVGLLLGGLLSIDLWITLQAREHLTRDPEFLRPTEYGVVLGTAKYYSGGGLNPFYQARMDAAAALYHSGLVEQLIASGDHSTPFYDEPGMMLEDLVIRDVPEQVILRDGGGIRTLNSVRRLQTEFGQSEVIIVSQRFHLERALYQARAAGIDAQGYIAADAPFRWHIRVRTREILARVSAMIDIHILRRAQDPLLHP